MSISGALPAASSAWPRGELWADGWAGWVAVPGSHMAPFCALPDPCLCQGFILGWSFGGQDIHVIAGIVLQLQLTHTHTHKNATLVPLQLVQTYCHARIWLPDLWCLSGIQPPPELPPMPLILHEHSQQWCSLGKSTQTHTGFSKYWCTGPLLHGLTPATAHKHTHMHTEHGPWLRQAIRNAI